MAIAPGNRATSDTKRMAAGLKSLPSARSLAMSATIEPYVWQVFQAILAATSIQTRGRLLAALLSGLPQGLQDELGLSLLLC